MLSNWLRTDVNVHFEIPLTVQLRHILMQKKRNTPYISCGHCIINQCHFFFSQEKARCLSKTTEGGKQEVTVALASLAYLAR